MSFGAAVPSRGRALPAEAPCPCGGMPPGASYGDCCGPILAGATAPSPERLMRSRFTAFALGDAAHLRRSWHPSTAPGDRDGDLALDADLRWKRLEIVHADSDGRRGTVEFRAHWRHARTGERGQLHEVSRFRLAGGHWYYLDGVVDE